jgi:predicted nucleic acid-binding protein
MTDDLAASANGFVNKGLTGYDACYAALALNLKGCWLTFDKKAHEVIEKDGISWLLTKSVPESWPFGR